MPTSLEHAPISYFHVIDDCLQIGGISLNTLLKRVGQTPFYAYDKSVIGQKVSELRSQLPQDIQLHYALKANPLRELVGFLIELVDGVDVASVGELKLALNTLVPPETISFAGPGKRFVELETAIAAGINVFVESHHELQSVVRIAESTGNTPRVGIRVNPDFQLRSSGMKMGGNASPFGIDSELVPALLSDLDKSLKFVGFHIFCGSQCLSAHELGRIYEQTFELVYQLSEKLSEAPETINIGGGLGIPYFPGEAPLDLASLGQHLERLMLKKRANFPVATVIMELGRFLVGEAGVYVCSIQDKKVSRGVTYLITDGGLHHNLAATGNFGQVLRKNYPVVIGNRIAGDQRETVTVVGPLCTPLDLLADRVELAKAKIGDLVVVHQSGAYGFSASPTGFLNHPPPQEILI